MTEYVPYERNFMKAGIVSSSNGTVELRMNTTYCGFYRNNRLSKELDNSQFRFIRDEVYGKLKLTIDDLEMLCATAIKNINAIGNIGIVPVLLGNMRIEKNKLYCGEDYRELSTGTDASIINGIITLIREHSIDVKELLVIIVEKLARYCFDKEKLKEVVSLYCNGEPISKDDIVYLRRKLHGSKIGYIEKIFLINGDFCKIRFKKEDFDFVVGYGELLTGKYSVTEEMKTKFNMLDA